MTKTAARSRNITDGYGGAHCYSEALCVLSSLEELTTLTSHTQTCFFHFAHLTTHLFPLSPQLGAKHCLLRISPWGLGSERACPAPSPHPPLRGADVSALLPGDSVTHLSTLTVRLHLRRPAADRQTLQTDLNLPVCWFVG